MPTYVNVTPCPISYMGTTFYPGIPTEADFRVSSSRLVEISQIAGSVSSKPKRQYRKKQSVEHISEPECSEGDKFQVESIDDNSLNADLENSSDAIAGK